MGFFDFFKKFGGDNTQQIDQVDQSILNSVPANCVMIVEDVFTITGRGIVVIGTVLRNSINLNDSLTIMESGRIARVIGIEAFRKQQEVAEAGMRIGLVLADVSREDLMTSYKLLKM